MIECHIDFEFRILRLKLISFDKSGLVIYVCIKQLPKFYLQKMALIIGRKYGWSYVGINKEVMN